MRNKLAAYFAIHGTYQGTVEAKTDGILIDDVFVPCTAIRDPAELPWSKIGVDYVVESTGLFTSYDGAHKHLQAGAMRVVMSAPTKDPDKVKTLVMRVNHQEFDLE